MKYSKNGKPASRSVIIISQILTWLIYGVLILLLIGALLLTLEFILWISGSEWSF